MPPIITITQPINNNLIQNQVTVPGSKYLANRLLIIAALAEGTTTLHNLPVNHDIEIAGMGVEAIGAGIIRNENTWQIRGTGGKINPSQIFTGENGTFSRFAVALAGLGDQPVSLNSAPRMQERPMGNILTALQDLGVVVTGEAFPLTITGPLLRGETSLKGNISSQYFSALALTLPYAQPHGGYSKEESYVEILTPLVSKDYLTMTLDLMAQFGVNARLESGVKKNSGGTLVIPPGRYQSREYSIEADPVSATYFMGLAALSGNPLLICDYPSHSLQGESNFPQLLEKMGCQVEKVAEGLQVYPPRNNLQGIEVDMTHMPDATPTLAVLAACAQGKTRITGIAHLRHKESNRVEDIAEELRKAGIKVKTGNQFMEIEGGNPCPALLDSHNDHRLVMSLSLLSLRCREVKIKNHSAVKKSFPDYFNKLQELGFTITNH